MDLVQRYLPRLCFCEMSFENVKWQQAESVFCIFPLKWYHCYYIFEERNIQFHCRNMGTHQSKSWKMNVLSIPCTPVKEHAAWVILLIRRKKKIHDPHQGHIISAPQVQTRRDMSSNLPWKTNRLTWSFQKEERLFFIALPLQVLCLTFLPFSCLSVF